MQSQATDVQRRSSWLLVRLLSPERHQLRQVESPPPVWFLQRGTWISGLLIIGILLSHTGVLDLLHPLEETSAREIAS